jgi:hypothetical protein
MIIWFWRRRCSSRSRRRWRSASRAAALLTTRLTQHVLDAVSSGGAQVAAGQQVPGRGDTRLQLACRSARCRTADHSAAGGRPGGLHDVQSRFWSRWAMRERSSSRSSRAMRRTRANRRRLRLRSRMMRRASSRRLRSCGSRKADAGRVSFRTCAQPPPSLHLLQEAVAVAGPAGGADARQQLPERVPEPDAAGCRAGRPLHQVAALPDDVCQVAVIQLAQIAGRAQILPRLAVHVAGVTCRRLLRLLRLLAALALGNSCLNACRTCRCRLPRRPSFAPGPGPAGWSAPGHGHSSWRRLPVERRYCRASRLTLPLCLQVAVAVVAAAAPAGGAGARPLHLERVLPEPAAAGCRAGRPFAPGPGPAGWSAPGHGHSSGADSRSSADTARLAVHVAGIGLLRLLRLLLLLLRLLLLLAGLFRSPVGKFPPDLPDAPRRHGFGQIGLTTLQPLQPLLQLLDAHLLEALSRILRDGAGAAMLPANKVKAVKAIIRVRIFINSLHNDSLP